MDMKDPTKRRYKVISDKVGSELGPHKVQTVGSDRLVLLTVSEAKFYVDQGVIRAL